MAPVRRAVSADLDRRAAAALWRARRRKRSPPPLLRLRLGPPVGPAAPRRCLVGAAAGDVTPAPDGDLLRHQSVPARSAIHHGRNPPKPRKVRCAQIRAARYLPRMCPASPSGSEFVNLASVGIELAQRPRHRSPRPHSPCAPHAPPVPALLARRSSRSRTRRRPSTFNTSTGNPARRHSSPVDVRRRPCLTTNADPIAELARSPRRSPSTSACVSPVRHRYLANPVPATSSSVPSATSISGASHVSVTAVRGRPRPRPGRRKPRRPRRDPARRRGSSPNGSAQALNPVPDQQRPTRALATLDVVDVEHDVGAVVR
jgi:hypothetical protein